MTSELTATALLDAVETNHWMMNDPGVGAHRYYHDDWYCIALATGDGRWSATVLHSGEAAGGLVHDVRAEERFDSPEEAMRWAEEEVRRRRADLAPRRSFVPPRH